MELVEKVREIVMRETGIDLSNVDPKKALRSQVNLDSMKFVEVYAALVDELQIEISPDFLAADTLEEINLIIKRAAEGN